ncbi:purple acid phosphatase family protein [Nocardioides stalactiti]|uniref:purple acid phosphatase family protein n=1 Tax=Nocardioides stalactiti TaxID=2755356 RepID=UPI0015FF174E|nr:metallophosphoesterase family protein [Nocardioides stalactiti]
MPVQRRTLLAGVPAGVVGTNLLTRSRPSGASAAAAAGPVPDRVVLNPTALPAQAVTVTWRTDVSTRDGFAEYVPVHGGRLGRKRSTQTRVLLAGAGMGVPARHHTVTMDALEPATSYRYRVGSPATGWSGWHRFRTAARSGAPVEPWTFLYFGDAQISLDDVWPATVELALARHPGAALSLHAGDLVNDADQDDQWHAWFAGAGPLASDKLVVASPGNHEYHGDDLLQQYRAHFGMPDNGPRLHREDVWFADYQGVRFVSLNGNAPLGGAEQAAWVRRVLSRSPMRWSVVTFHQPMFSATPERDNALTRASWLPVFEEVGVDLVLQGHDHTYARGHLAVNEVGDGTHTGPVYVVSNAGGKYYELDRAADNDWTRNGAVRAVAYEGVTTYQAVRVHDDRLVYTARASRFRDDVHPYGFTEDEVVDQLTVERLPDGSKRVVPWA